MNKRTQGHTGWWLVGGLTVESEPEQGVRTYIKFSMDLDTPTNDGAAGGSRPNQHQHLPAAIGGVDPRTNIDHSPLIDEARLAVDDDLRQRSGGHRSSNFDVSNVEGFTQNENFAKPDGTNLEEPTWRHPIRSTRKFFKELNGHFGKRFLIWLGVVQCAVR